jgi:flagellar capping protein FliD
MQKKLSEVSALSEQLMGERGLDKQIEKTRREIHDRQKEFKTAIKLYKLDYQKIKILTAKMSNRKSELTQSTKRQ